jgi:outer membrane receptor protein involved in Fe transport
MLLMICTGSAAAQVQVTGSVQDPSGAVIPGAAVTLKSEHSSLTVTSGANGGFSFAAISDISGAVSATANGFATVEQKWSAASNLVTLNLILKPLVLGERITVSATRTSLKLSEVPGSIVQLSSDDVHANPSLTTDDLLRQVPGFSLFRRSSSRVANPTTQGVSLRGLGASGPSRALVLEDGVSLVDPFGGWVYWDRIPRTKISSVDVFRGGSSSLYGSDALAGVVQFLSRLPSGPTISVDTSYGTESTPDLSVFAGTTISRWDISASTEMAHTDGYILVPSAQRGTIDTAANSEHAALDAQLGYKFPNNGRAFLRGTFFDEARHNGTPFQKNSTATGFGVAGINTAIGTHDYVAARLFGQAQGYDQTFSSIQSINSTRDSEQPTNIQHVPSQEGGGSLQWNHILKSHTLIAGFDLQEVMGASDEQLLLASASKVSGGRQFSSGLFGQDIFRLGSKWTVIAGARWDRWKNFDGSTLRFPLPSGAPFTQLFADRTENSFSPRLSFMRALNSNISLSLSGYRAFRAPTLNELYRSFQQGTITTRNNPQLRAERLTGAEAGLKATGLNNRIETRATLFWSDIVDPVTNVTLDATTRQRENLGRTRSLGTELDGVLRLSSTLEISAGYQYTHATVVDSPSLAGKFVPEVPQHQFTWEARYWRPSRVMCSVQGRFSSSQFDDDLNTLVLNRYYTMNLFLGRKLNSGLAAYVAAENLLNRRYAVALTPPVLTLGPPIVARIGLRYDFPASQ